MNFNLFRPVPAQILHFLESATAQGSDHSALGSPENQPRDHKFVSPSFRLSSFCPSYFPFLSSLPSFSPSFLTSSLAFMLRSSVCCLGFIFFFWLSAFLSFGFLLIPFVRLLSFRSSAGPALNLWAKKSATKSCSPEQCKAMGNKCKSEIQGGHYATMKLYPQNR